MSNLIERFKEDLKLAGYAKRSIQSYTSAFTINRFTISLKNSSVNTGFAVRMSSAGAPLLCVSVTLVFNIFLPERWSGPGIFSVTSNGNVNRKK